MFTADNTEGFSGQDLATLNAALEILMMGRGDRDREEFERSCMDALNNVWFEGARTDELVTHALRVVG